MSIRSLFKIWVLVILITPLLQGCFLENDGPQPDEVFVKFYGGDGADELVDIGYLASEDSYILLGNTNSFSNRGLSDIHLLKTNNEGNFSDELILDLGNNDSTSDVSSSLKIFSDRIAVIGSTESLDSTGVFQNKRLFYAILDYDLNIVLSDTISYQDEDLTGNDIIMTSDGNLVMLATTGETTDLQRDLYYTKRSIADGSSIWQRVNSVPGVDVGISVIELQNGDIAICSQTDRTSVRGYGGVNALYLVVNNLGLLKNALAYGRSNGASTNIDDVPTKMINDASGALIIGNSNINGEQEPFVIQMTNQGAIDTLRNLDPIPDQSDIEVKDVKRALNGDLIFVGNFKQYVLSAEEVKNEETPKGQQILFLRTDQFGTTNLTSCHHGDGFTDRGEAVIQLPDGQILIGGTISFGANLTKMVLMKVNGSGKLLK